MKPRTDDRPCPVGYRVLQAVRSTLFYIRFTNKTHQHMSSESWALGQHPPHLGEWDTAQWIDTVTVNMGSGGGKGGKKKREKENGFQGRRENQRLDVSRDL
ncbi:hypothetical protein NHX12_024953 [Muraenolepis orangiensis]|uniref:Uncharacterized protein n=1 Tax=Muraenolepis orangiensis TaxID=630683 RepID=A0A9Q0IP78_9TELE|nr:hypothetical protein NHX12_024953 [Muraenolepis orangiensis]